MQDLQTWTKTTPILVLVVRTRGTSPQLRTHIGGRTKRRRPNQWPYGWSILVIGLDIKQARTFND